MKKKISDFTEKLLLCLQVGHIKKNTPLIFIGKMWADFLRWARDHFLSNQLVNPKDLEIPYCANTSEEAIAILQKYHEKWLKEKQ